MEVYQRPHDEKRPVLCIDETNRQLIGETREPRPAAQGRHALHDYEYVRNGVANLFMAFEPLGKRRQVTVTQRRTAKDFAYWLQDISDKQYPQAEKIILVMDNLNTHNLASLYAAFEPQEAHRLCRRFEIHYTPRHGSWLNMAELEIGVLSRQCLNRRIADIETMEREVQAWASRPTMRKARFAGTSVVV